MFVLFKQLNSAHCYGDLHLKQIGFDSKTLKVILVSIKVRLVWLFLSWGFELDSKSYTYKTRSQHL